MVLSKRLVLVIKFLFFSILLNTFNKGYSQRLEITGSTGGSIYQGDLAVGYVPSPKVALSLGLTYDLSSRFRIRENTTYCKVWGDDKKSSNVGIKGRNLNFKSHIYEAALLGEYDLRNSDFNNLIPYIFVGPGIFHFDPETIDGNFNLRRSGTEGQNFSTGKYADRVYNLTQFNIQYGLGFRIQLAPNVSFGVEGSWRKLFTDYLDDVSTNSYISKQEWDAELAKAKASGDKQKIRYFEQGEYLSWQYLDDKGNSVTMPLKPGDQGTGYARGNPNKNDAYYTFQTRLNITLFSGSDGFGSTSDLYSPRSPYGRGQLRCPKKVF